MSLRKFRLSTLKKYTLFGFRTTRQLLSQYEARGHKSQQAPLFAVTDFSHYQYHDIKFSMTTRTLRGQCLQPSLGASQKRS